MTKARLVFAILMALAVACTSACVYINVKDLPSQESHEAGEAMEAEHEAPAEHAEELEILRDQIHALERENAELSDHIETLERALHEERDDEDDEHE